MIESLTIGGVTIGPVSSGYLIKSLNGFDFSEIDVNIKRRGFYDGSSLSYFFLGKRNFSIEGQIWGDDPEDYEDKRRALEQALNVKRGLQTMTFSTRGGLDLQADVILTTPLELPYQAGQMVFGDFRIELSAPYPFLLGQTPKSDEIHVSSGGGFAIPFSIPLPLASGGTGVETLTNEGNANAYPIITLYGPMTNPGLKNQTNGERFSVSAVLGSTSDYIQIDTYYRIVKRNNITNYRAYFSGDFITLDPGDNEFRLSASASSGLAKAVVSWRDHYQGI